MRAHLLGFTMICASACASDHEASSSDSPLIGTCSEPMASDSYDLGNLSIDGDQLLVHVTTGGGCSRHSFAMCWDGAVNDTYPPTVDLALSHDAHGDTCDALLEHDLRFDLTPIIEAVHPPVALHVTGASTQLAGTSNTVIFGN